MDWKQERVGDWSLVDSNLSNREWDDNEMRNEPDKLSFTGANKPNNIHIIKDTKQTAKDKIEI